jgi:hypothetical protein
MFPIINRKNPFNLEELRIEDCKIEKEILKELFISLCENCLLSKLALVNVGIDEYSFEYLCVILENS